MTREISPLEAIWRRGWGDSPGLGEKTNSASSNPEGVGVEEGSSWMENPA